MSKDARPDTADPKRFSSGTTCQTAQTGSVSDGVATGRQQEKDRKPIF
jgi:hypothetical protein